MMDFVYVLFLLSTIGVCASPINKDGKPECEEMPEYELEEILGPAYNARYMSLTPPPPEDESRLGAKRGIVSDAVDFYVAHDLEVEIETRPAWAVTNHVEAAREQSFRFKRDLDYSQEWHCKQRIKWLDLGPDYFPRYLKSVECLSETCWFNIYKCRPRSFAVKLLKRRRDRCTAAPDDDRIGSSGLPRELRELWVWEERAVTFCCDCGI
ncbi:unnamed protein product [Callosobruchus maculatus]|uniref:Spaetzle domain-containing protein n=1 Tax=Callosobruchus maculatus TaxID=64391 RepID=A0A653C521_CALMS|nr:unnamed protein product [Callosobruchus maculatus]